MYRFYPPGRARRAEQRRQSLIRLDQVRKRMGILNGVEMRRLDHARCRSTHQPIRFRLQFASPGLAACVVSIQGSKPKQLMRRSRLSRTVRGDIRRLHIVHVLAPLERSIPPRLCGGQFRHLLDSRFRNGTKPRQGGTQYSFIYGCRVNYVDRVRKPRHSWHQVKPLRG